MRTIHLLSLCLVLSIVSRIYGVEILSSNVQGDSDFCIDESNDICGYYRVSESTVEDMISVCFWDRKKKRYNSFCKRRSEVTNGIRRYEFIDCGCCDEDTHTPLTINGEYCSYTPPVCGGDASCPEPGQQAGSMVCIASGNLETSTCVDPFAEVTQGESYTCGSCGTASAPPPTLSPTSPPTSPPTPSPTPSSPPTPLPLLKNVGNNGSPSGAFPLKLCQGDCDSDSECQGDLKCMQRDGKEGVPGCRGNGRSGIDYCYNPFELKVVGNDGSPANKFPLGMCEGDCDSDNECRNGLVCIERDGFEAIPGCEGLGTSGNDYCTDPNLVIGQPKVISQPQGTGIGDPTYGFRLRLYWHRDYFWQETKAETWWCMECTKCNGYTLGDGIERDCQTPSSCQSGNNIWIRPCKGHSRDFKFNVLKNPGSGDQIRVDNTNLCLSTVDNRYLEVRSCDKGSPRQLWNPVNGLSKFELRPYDQRTRGLNNAKCLSQLHHPKSQEVVGLHNCRTADNHETRFWEEF